jgi:hypothetical protein
VGDLARKEDVSAGAENGLFPIADEGELAVEDVEGLVFGVVEMIGRGVARRVSCQVSEKAPPVESVEAFTISRLLRNQQASPSFAATARGSRSVVGMFSSRVKNEGPRACA